MSPNEGIPKKTPSSFARCINRHGAWIARVFFCHVAQEFNSIGIKELAQANNAILFVCVYFALSNLAYWGIVHNICPS